ncbi:MAG: anti-sigma factor family protein [Ktedonobacteraceae bacterium]
MAQHDNRHLTTEQLSDLLDKQLSPQEQAEYNAHLQTCQHCQKTLADLKQTVALLHALPQPALPHSFVLPVSQTAPTPMAHTQEQRRRHIHPITTTTRRTRIHRGGSFARQSVRVLSTLAAVIGIVFFISGFLASIQHGSSTTASTGSSAGTTNGSATSKPQIHSVGTPQTQASPAMVHTPSITAPKQKQTPTSTATPQNRNQTHQNSARSPAIDLNSPQVHLGLGTILLLIGILGVVLTRKRRE